VSSTSPFVCCRCAESLIGGPITWSRKDRRYAHTACLARSQRAAARARATRARNATEHAADITAAVESPETAAIRAAMRRARVMPS
jgi:hypothetical protein